ncbi:MAG: TAXI family TRAP transporter solute-binding subunit [Spirochaetaceae bacterium]|jgi:TRAP transporter TAXI family solute receptor|nr:TAXI family TRAP transporter solute-binding subunit [Spirochaetaceae bacterium]
MKKPLVLAGIAILTLALGVNPLWAAGKSEKAASAASSSAIQPPSSPYKYSLAGGSVGGNFYLMGGGLAQTINKHLPQYFLFTAETTGGSTANITMLQSGEAELGIVMTSALSEAVRGEAPWTKGVKHTKLRGAVPLYPSWLTLVTLKNSGIKTLKDLNGKRVGLGSKGAALDSIFRQFLQDQGIVPAQIHNDGHGATAVALGNGVIEAALHFSYPPFAAIAELESTKDLFFIPLTQAEQDALVKTYDFYSRGGLPAGSYKGITEEVRGVSEWNMLATSVDVPEDLVYLIVKTLFENQADMLAVHSSSKFIAPEYEANFNIPLHAGAVRYLREKGVAVPAALIPPEYKGK